MGGKSKQSQRTKNNVRPSSSGRSAEQLSNFTIEQAAKGGRSQVPSLFPRLATPFLDPLITPELQLCFKKLNKKDPITKAKALQELSELVTQSKVDDVVIALSSWTHFYKILSIDPDRKVRELTQLCHGSIVSVCGRRVAPALRALMAAWLQAQHDDHAPARTLAERSLQTTFPENKLPEVLSFCKDEVVSHLLDNLTGNGEATALKKLETSEEQAEWSSRLACSSLHGLQFVVARLGAQHDEWLWARLDAAMTASVWWRRATAPDARLRAAFYAATARIVERFPNNFAEKYGSKLLKIAVGNRELNPLVAGQLWDCLLLFMHNVKEWHNYLDKKELFVKRVLDVLESGGWGDARQLSNMLLPLLANLSEEVLTEEFYVAFFDALFAGLEKKSISSSKMEREWWLSSVEECVRFVSARGAAAALLGPVLRRWLRAALRPRGARAPAAAHLARLLRYWLRQTQHNYHLLVRNFWETLNSTLEAELAAAPDAELRATLETHAALLMALDVDFQASPNKKAGVKFADEEGSESSGEMKGESEVGPEGIARHRQQLARAVRGLVARAVGRAEPIPEQALAPVLPLLPRFSCAALWAEAGEALGARSPHSLYEALRPWLADPARRSRALLDFIFAALPHMTDEEQDAVFASFDTLDTSAIELCVAVSVRAGGGRARAWAGGARAGEALRAAAARAAAGHAPAADLLLDCLRALGPHSLPRGVARAVGGEAAAALAAGGGAAAAALALRLRDVLPPDERLAAALLQVALLNKPARLGAERWAAAARAAAELGDAAVGAAVARRLAASSDILGDEETFEAPELEITSDDDDDGATLTEQMIEEIEHIVAVCSALGVAEWDRARCAALWRAAGGEQAGAGGEEAGAGGEEAGAGGAGGAAGAVCACAARADVARGRLSVPLGACALSEALVRERVAELTKAQLGRFARATVFSALLLRAAARGAGVPPPAGCALVRDYMLLQTLHQTYAFWPHYDVIDQTKSRLDTIMDELIEAMSPSNRLEVLRCLSEQAVAKGFYWAYGRVYFENKLKELDKILESADESPHQEIVDKESVVTADESTTNTGLEDKENATTVEDGASSQKQGDIQSLDVERIPDDMITGNGFFHTLQAEDREDGEGAAEYWAWARALLAGGAAPPAPAPAAPARPALDCALHYCDRHPAHVLGLMDVSGCPWWHVTGNAHLARFLRRRLAGGWAHSAAHWDFTALTACALLASVDRSRAHWGRTKVSCLASAALRLLAGVARFVRGVPARAAREAAAPHVARLPTEWRDVFAPDAITNFFSFVQYLLESSSTTVVTSNHVEVISAAMEACSEVEWELLPAARRAEGAGPLARACGAALAGAAHGAFKGLAHALLARLLDPLVLDDAERLAAWSAAAEAGAPSAAPPVLSLNTYIKTLLDTLETLETKLSSVVVLEDTARLRRGGALHAAAAGALLLADALHAQCRRAHHDLPHHYNTIYRESGVAEQLARLAFRLLPPHVLPAGGDGPVQPLDRAMFAEMPPLDPYRGAPLEWLACCSALGVLRAGAAPLRAWRAAAAPRAAAALDHVAARYVSPLLAADEFALLLHCKDDIEDAEVSVSAASLSALCRLEVDGRTLELGVTLARTHPLAPPVFSAPPPAHHTAWLVLYMAYQNGSLLGAVRMWAAAVTARVERAAPCYVCYCRLHPASGLLPAVICYQCNNKFHDQCLRKWFASSNKSNCPLCRSKF